MFYKLSHILACLFTPIADILNKTFICLDFKSDLQFLHSGCVDAKGPP